MFQVEEGEWLQNILMKRVVHANKWADTAIV